MRTSIIATLLAIAFATPASAQPAAPAANPCKAGFDAYMLANMTGSPGVGRIFSGPVGGKQVESEYTYLGPDHGMYRPINPATGMWVLSWKNARYSSTDGGKTWKRISSRDPASERAEGIKIHKKLIASARNHACGQETIEGVVHDRYAVDVDEPSVSHNTYWISRKTGKATKSTFVTKAGGRDYITTQYWKPAGETQLPKP